MTGSPDLAIRLRRAAFNRALADQNLAAITPILSPHVVMVTGSDSAVLSGRPAQLKAWKREFSSATPMLYTRSPGSITLSPIEPIALEHGVWEGRTAESDAALVSGQYSAKWRQIGEDWVIIAEIFITLA